MHVMYVTCARYCLLHMCIMFVMYGMWFLHDMFDM